MNWNPKAWEAPYIPRMEELQPYTLQELGKVYTPGHPTATRLGCTCAVLDNAHGKGFGEPPKFWITEGCPLHALPKPAEEARKEE